MEKKEKKKFSMPKIIMETPKPGQSMEDFKREMEMKHSGMKDAKVVDAKNMDPAQLEAMLAGMGISKEQFAEMTGSATGEKKPGIFKRIQNALLE